MKRAILSLLPLVALVSLGASEGYKPHSFTLRVESAGNGVADFVATSDGAELQIAGSEERPGQRVCARTPANVRGWHGVRSMSIEGVGARQAVRVTQGGADGARLGHPAAGRPLTMRLTGERFLA